MANVRRFRLNIGLKFLIVVFLVLFSIVALHSTLYNLEYLLYRSEIRRSYIKNILHEKTVTDTLFVDKLNVTLSEEHILYNNEYNYSSNKAVKRLLNRENNNSLRYFKHRNNVFLKFYRPVSYSGTVNCSAILLGDQDEVDKAANIMKNTSRNAISIDDYANISDCETFKRRRGYIEDPLSKREQNFPLAFTIAVYKDIEQAERLLRAIYRPHNYYCIHLDSKMNILEKTSFENVVNCFNNVFVVNTSLDVEWGEFSVLEVELLCMKALWRYKSWKYYINLTGQEFPLKTNREIVAILETMRGANIVDGTWIRAEQMYLYRWMWAGKLPPHRIRPIKGSVHVAVNRQFVDFALYDNRSLDFIEWLKDTDIPDESFFSTLNHNPHLGINGSFLGEAEEYPLKPSIMRYKNWELGHSVYVRSCSGKFVRNICVLGVGDIHKAYSDVGMFANKFHWDFEYLGLDCLEQELHEKTWRQYINDEEIDTTYYSYLDYVRKKLFVPPTSNKVESIATNV